ncbi:hypothetical protein ABH900_002328 [Stenotrophomonas sp. AN71]|uniref:hypothetical protein n=1 Tax=Stenotrophomonas sp. AN71 TaxID=3156253 RepID=UPI003D1E6938
MKSNHPLLAAALLGSFAIAAPVLAHEPAPPIPPDSATAADVPAVDAAAATAVEDTAAVTTPVVPAWEGRVPLSVKLQVGADGQPVGDKMLRLVQRSATGKLVAAQVAVSLFSGTLGGSSFKKDQLKGTRVETVPNPAFGYLQDQVRLRLAEYFTAHPGAVPAEARPVQITADGFTLIYKELGDADTQYELRQTQHVGFPYTRKLLRLVGGEGVQCQVDEPVAATLEAWQADDYALVRQTAERYSDQCLARFVETLPSLFPDRSAAAAPVKADAARDGQGA